jgi:tetratricopeptide (TPR) repeat protein/two-component sensor histidine kinase
VTEGTGGSIPAWDPTAAGRRVAVEEEARRRIAREIHDDLGQRLAALGIELRVARRKFPEDGPQRRELDAVAGSLAELAEDLRRLSHDLHPAVLERSGLAEALRDHCAEVERRHGLPVRLSLQAEGPFPPDLTLGLYRIAQEALANIVRHAGARSVQVTLRTAGGDVHLAVVDDGAGFDPQAARGSGGLGLASLDERARLLGGRCRIASSPGAGTRIEVAVPMPGPELHRLRRLVRRHRGFLASAALVILALAGGLFATVLQTRRAEQESRRADEVARFLEELFRASDPRQARGVRPDTRELLRRGTERLGKETRIEPLLRARLLDTLGGIHTELGLFDEARSLLDKALAIREHGGEPPEIAATLVHLGALAHLSGKGDAVPLFRRALALRESSLGPESAEVAEVLNDLGTSLAAKGQFDEAETTLRRTLALQERLWGGRDPRVAKTLHNLSGIAYYRGRLDDTERLLRRSLAIREAVLAPDDLDLAGSREALALLLRRRGRPVEAAALLERQVPIAEKIYGPEHPELARILLNLGLVRVDLGEDAAARRLLERALAIDEKALQPDHRQLVHTLAELADLHTSHGRYAEAEPLYQRLIALRDEGAPYDQWEPLFANWVRFLRATGRNVEAGRVEASLKSPRAD